MVIIVEKGYGDPNSNLEKAVCISPSVNFPGKDMDPVILSPDKGKSLGRTGFFNFSIAADLEGKL